MKKSIKITILVIACMHLPMQAMLSQISRFRALQRARVSRTSKPGVTFAPKIPQQQRFYATKPQPSSWWDTVKSWLPGGSSTEKLFEDLRAIKKEKEER